MRIKTTSTRNGRLFYVIKTYYDAKGKEHSITIEKLGNENAIREKYNCDPDIWAKEYVKKLNNQEKLDNAEVQISFSPSSRISRNHQYEFNIGYLILQSLYYQLGIDKICNAIKAHFLTCFIALIVYRYLEKKLNSQFTCDQLIETLQDMEVRELIGEGYLPAYTRTDITDALHDTFGFRTDSQIITQPMMKKILKEAKPKIRHAKI